MTTKPPVGFTTLKDVVFIVVVFIAVMLGALASYVLMSPLLDDCQASYSACNDVAVEYAEIANRCVGLLQDCITTIEQGGGIDG